MHYLHLVQIGKVIAIDFYRGTIASTSHIQRLYFELLFSAVLFWTNIWTCYNKVLQKCNSIKNNKKIACGAFTINFRMEVYNLSCLFLSLFLTTFLQCLVNWFFFFEKMIEKENVTLEVNGSTVFRYPIWTEPDPIQFFQNPKARRGLAS